MQAEASPCPTVDFTRCLPLLLFCPSGLDRRVMLADRRISRDAPQAGRSFFTGAGLHTFCFLLLASRVSLFSVFVLTISLKSVWRLIGHLGKRPHLTGAYNCPLNTQWNKNTTQQHQTHTINMGIKSCNRDINKNMQYHYYNKSMQIKSTLNKI